MIFWCFSIRQLFSLFFHNLCNFLIFGTFVGERLQSVLLEFSWRVMNDSNPFWNRESIFFQRKWNRNEVFFQTDKLHWDKEIDKTKRFWKSNNFRLKVKKGPRDSFPNLSENGISAYIETRLCQDAHHRKRFSSIRWQIPGRQKF